MGSTQGTHKPQGSSGMGCTERWLCPGRQRGNRCTTPTGFVNGIEFALMMTLIYHARQGWQETTQETQAVPFPAGGTCDVTKPQARPDSLPCFPSTNDEYFCPFFTNTGKMLSLCISWAPLAPNAPGCLQAGAERSPYFRLKYNLFLPGNSAVFQTDSYQGARRKSVGERAQGK